MKKSLVLNFQVLKSYNISVEEFLFMYYIYIKEKYSTTNIDSDKLQKEQLIKIIEKKETKEYYLREKAIELIESLLIEISNSLKTRKKTVKKSNRAINNELEGRIDEFRSKWKGLKPGSMGSLKSCKVKLTRWIKENPEYTFEDILKASDIYINSLNGDYRFLQRADYFIFKQENNREESSRLSAYIDEIHLISTDEWTSKLN